MIPANEKSRRAFIIRISKILGILTGSTVLKTKPLQALTFENQSNAIGRHSETTSISTDSSKILVVYESDYRSTAEVAWFIGEQLLQKGVGVDVKRIEEIESVSSYSKVIVGSPIQYDNWMPSAREFVKKHKIELKKKQAAFFFTCLVLHKQTKENMEQARSYADKISSAVLGVKPESVGCFAGMLDYSRMSIITRLIARPVFAIKGVKEGDYRDWDAIRSWVQSLGFYKKPGY